MPRQHRHYLISLGDYFTDDIDQNIIAHTKTSAMVYLRDHGFHLCTVAPNAGTWLNDDTMTWARLVPVLIIEEVLHARAADRSNS